MFLASSAQSRDLRPRRATVGTAGAVVVAAAIHGRRLAWYGAGRAGGGRHAGRLQRSERRTGGISQRDDVVAVAIQLSACNATPIAAASCRKLPPRTARRSQRSASQIAPAVRRPACQIGPVRPPDARQPTGGGHTDWAPRRAPPRADVRAPTVADVRASPMATERSPDMGMPRALHWTTRHSPPWATAWCSPWLPGDDERARADAEMHDPACVDRRARAAPTRALRPAPRVRARACVAAGQDDGARADGRDGVALKSRTFSVLRPKFCLVAGLASGDPDTVTRRGDTPHLR